MKKMAQNTQQATAQLSQNRINALLAGIGMFAAVAAFVVGYAVGHNVSEKEIENARALAVSTYQQQAYKVCFAKERELESFNSQRARRSCEYLKDFY